PRTRAIIVNSPNNPSGMVFSADFVGAVVRLCEDRGIHAIMDDIYHKLVFDGVTAPSCYDFTSRDIDDSRVIVINGVAKTYGMTGFRIGWAIAGRDIVGAMATMQSQTTSCVSSLCQVSAEGALLGPQDEVEGLRAAMEHNRDVIVQELGALPGVRMIKPQGTFYCLPDFSAYLKPGIASDSFELSMFLLQKARVVTVPGRDFGVEGHLRLSYAGTAADVVEGMRRIRWALDGSEPREIEIGGRTMVREWA
ncbi:MAG TPA: aminotransferase class I/II-fold pyridoxal phosphate-dependent enzyme, partial [Vicinamibacterales bacterium]|nr:aminotransferase class I/II-fold pyridoxal phosphate-dependent enzyme [Vicinamibacterales bacterium]